MPIKYITLKVTLLLILIPGLLKAQKPESVIAKVFYKFTYNFDTVNVNRKKVENYVLFVGKSSSAYKNYDRLLQDSAIIANYKTSGVMAPPTGKRASSDELYYFFTTKKAFLKTKLLGDYIIERPFNKLDWKITDETKKIDNIVCQKATTNYMGRNYIAWFSTAYPLQAGPWKLHGLPGLIVSAYDQTGRIRFDFMGIKQVKDPKELIIWDKDAVNISWADYEKVAKSFENDPQAAIERTFHAKLTTNHPLPHRNLLAPDPSINFPLEVPAANNK